MPAPVAAAAIATVIVTSAAQQIGSRIGDAIADGIFGQSNDLKDVQKRLADLSAQLQEVLHYSRETYALVEQLPDIISGIVDQQTLYLAHNDIESSIQAYMRLQQWHGTIGYDTLTKLLSAWNIILDKEASTEKHQFLPRYGEFLLLVTNGQLSDSIRSGVEEKLAIINDLIEDLTKDRITPCATEIESILRSSHVKSGSLLEDIPWVSWVIHSHRTRTVTRCISRPCRHCNGDISRCWDEQIPDETWNSAVNLKNSRLQALSEHIGILAKQLRSAVLAREALKKYLMVLTARTQEKITMEHISVIESHEKFPAPII